MVIGLLLDDTLDRSDGVQQAVLSIGGELSIRGHEVHYIVSETKRTDIAHIHSMTQLLKFKFNGNSVRTPLPVSMKDVRKLFDDISFDVIHVQMPYSPLFAARIITHASKSTKIFGTFHILPFSNFSVVGTLILRLLLFKSRKQFSKSFAVSKPALQFMSRSFGMKGVVIPNPVDYEFFNAHKKLTSPRKHIVYIGRFEQRKGVKELITAYSSLPENLRASTTLTMCGSGPLLDEMKKYAEKEHITVDFPGFVTDEQKAIYLASATIAVFPSKSGESFGIVLSEAMSAGAEITLGGNNPGYASVLSRWQETLFNPKNNEEFKDILIKFLQNETLRKCIGLEQHESVKQYDVKRVVDTLITYYS